MLYRLLQLRAAVFVVEQACPYLDPDGRDLEPGALHVWCEDDRGEPVAVLRRLDEPGGGSRIGRVATRADARGLGLARRIVDAALVDAPRPVVLDAQSHLEGWYTAMGFVRTGAPFVEDGIPHVPMRLSS